MIMMRFRALRSSWLAGVLCVLAVSTAAAQTAAPMEELLRPFAWRSVGPALPGGRTTDIEAVEAKPWIIYAAVGPSGVWKSENAGTSWAPVFHKEATVSVGDLAVSQANPDIIWAGTGEATCRNSVTLGDGVYKSIDGGKTWTNQGLRETRHISRILINRGDPNIVTVAAMGSLWNANPERGVFKTIDGGKTWKKTLYIDENTGIADLAAEVKLKSVRLQLDQPPPAVGVRMNPRRLHRVFQNLIYNAADAMKDGGTIHLRFETSANEVVTHIQDTGPGIAPEIAGQLFEPFVTHGKLHGTGLGLSISCLLYTSPSPRDRTRSRMPSSA